MTCQACHILFHYLVKIIGYFDLILCDVVMPEESGIQWFQRISAGREELTSRWVFVSGGGLEEGVRADLVASESIFWDRGHQIPNSALAFPVRIDSTCAGLSFTASVA